MSDAYVQSQIQRANIAWQQACIRIVQVGPTMFVDAPKNTKGNDILEDGEFDIHDDAETVYDSYKAGMIIDRVDIFFVADFPKKELANAIQYRVGYQPFPHDEHAFIFIVPNLDIRFRTVAHEIGHVLADQPDSDNPLYIFFPKPDLLSRMIEYIGVDELPSIRPRLAEAAEYSRRHKLLRLRKPL